MNDIENFERSCEHVNVQKRSQKINVNVQNENQVKRQPFFE
jgi:hypothetical protein